VRIRVPAFCVIVVTLAFLAGCSRTQPASEIPRLQKQGTATQLIVDGKPSLMLAGERLWAASGAWKAPGRRSITTS